MYTILKAFITKQNGLYEQHNLAEFATLPKEELKKVRFQKWQFIHDYATELSDLILHNVDKIAKKDLPPLDLVPYTVWMRIPAKTRIIVDRINDQE